VCWCKAGREDWQNEGVLVVFRVEALVISRARAKFVERKLERSSQYVGSQIKCCERSGKI